MIKRDVPVIVDPARVTERPPEQAVEIIWHSELVAGRMIEAAATVKRMPMNIRPKEFGTIWPRFEPMTPRERVELFNELQQAGELEAWQRERNTIRVPPSGREIERAEEVLGWMPRYLGNDPEMAKIVGFWASKAYDLDAEIPAPIRNGLREIARGLRRDRIPVRA